MFPVQKVLFIISRTFVVIRWYIQKFPDWPPGARTANGIALWH